MIEVIKKYYEALKTNNLALFNEVVSPNVYGVRTYTEERLFTNEELINYFHTNTLKTYDILSCKTLNNITTIDLMINQKPVIAKITTQNNKIYKVYEIYQSNKRRIKCICSYDGSSYSGFQKQQNALSIQEEIENALKNILKVDTPVQSSGRTDKGVHALNQVFHFDTESSISESSITKVLNSYLPDAIHIISSEEVDLTFHSRYDVMEKTYEYVINTKEYNPIQRNYEWYVPNLDINKLQKDLNQILGTHDFQSFTKTTPNTTIRTINNVTLEEKENYLYITISGTGFLRYMVRNIIGALVSINQNKLKYTMKELLELKDVSLIKDKAPANGLYLKQVTY